MPRKKRQEPKRRRTRGAGSITTLADGVIRARLPSSVDAKRPSREFPPGRRDLAEAWLDAHLHPEAPTLSIVTLGDWLDEWAGTYVAPVRPPTTVQWVRYALRQLEPLYDVPLADLRTAQLQAIVATLAGRVAPATVANMAGVWRRCLEAAVEDELIPRNPARRLALPPIPPRPESRHVTQREVGLVWEKIRGHRFEAALALLFGCGLRIGEVLGLSWANVDLERRRAWIGPQFTHGGWQDIPKGRVAHYIPLPEPVIRALIRHRDAQPPGMVLVLQSEYPLTGKRKRQDARPRPWAEATIRQAFRELMRELGLNGVVPHSGRRGLSTALLNGGIPAADVAKLLGHSSPAITLRSYSMSSGNEGAVQDAVERYLSGDTERADGVG